MIDTMRSDFTVTELCQAMEVSQSGYYQWARSRQPSPRAEENKLLFSEMKAIHQDGHFKNYGSPRMTRELRARGFSCSENRVARIMAQEGLSARYTKKWKPQTTKQNPKHQPSANLLKDLDEITAPGQVWVSDITYVFVGSQTYYLAVVMDLFTRQIVGWELDEHMERFLVLRALEKAEPKRLRHAQKAIFHSDRGSQYTSGDIRKYLEKHRYKQSMSAKGYCYDNAACESFFASLKKEAFPEKQTFKTPLEARRQIFSYLETFYNSRRLHSSLDMMAPDDFHQAYLQSN